MWWLLGLCLQPLWSIVQTVGGGFSLHGLAFVPMFFAGLWNMKWTPEMRWLLRLGVFLTFLGFVYWGKLQWDMETRRQTLKLANDREMAEQCLETPKLVQTLPEHRAGCDPYILRAQIDPRELAADICLQRFAHNLLALTGGIMEKFALASLVALLAMPTWAVCGQCCQRTGRQLKEKRHKAQDYYAEEMLRQRLKRAESQTL